MVFRRQPSVGGGHKTLKKIILKILSPLIRLIVFGIGYKFAAWTIAAIAKVYAKHKSSPRGLKFLLDLDNKLYQTQGQLAIKYGNGIHTKHRHLNYHEFFIQHLRSGDKVLDIGSGNGALAYDIASRLNGTSIVGIEIDTNNYKFAIENYKHE